MSDTYYLRRARMLEFLDELKNIDEATASTVYLPPGLSVQEISDVLQSAAGKTTFSQELYEMIAHSRTGGVLFWGSARKCMVSPPFPLQQQAAFDGFVTEPLRKLLGVDYTIGLFLVHLGA